MKKKSTLSILGLVAFLALAAMFYLCSSSDMHMVTTEAQHFSQLPEGATAEVTLLKTMLHYFTQLLPTL